MTLYKYEHLLLFASLPLGDNEKEPVEYVERRCDVIDSVELCQWIFVEGFLMVDPLDLFHDLGQALLDRADVLDILGHLVKVNIVVELVCAFSHLL